MAVSIKQTVTGNWSAGTSGTATLGTITAGNLLVVVVGGGSSGSTISSISDGVNNYTKLDGIESGGASDGELWYVLSASAATTPTLTITASASDGYKFIFREYIGSFTLDKHTAASGSGSAISSGASASTTGSNDLVIGWYSQGGSSTPATVGSGYADLTTKVTGAASVGIEDKFITSSGPQTATFTGSGILYEAGVAAFILAGGTPTNLFFF
jgi:hypothetical protein